MINCYTSPNGDTLYFDCENSWRLHRLDGPAIECANGHKEWFINGKNTFCKTQKEFERLLKMKAFW